MNFLQRFGVPNTEQLKHLASACHGAGVGLLVVHGFRSLADGDKGNLIGSFFIFLGLELAGYLVLGWIQDEDEEEKHE